MNRIVRRRLEMAIRVRDFSRAHPAADASYAAVHARLEDRIARMEAVAKQQQSGYLAAHSAVIRRRAELGAVSDEVMQIVEVLDGVNRYRFGGQAEMRAAWESARNVVSEASSAGSGELVKEGEVKPAA